MAACIVAWRWAMERRCLELTAAQRAELEHPRDRDRRPYLRACAAALLQVADGQPAYLVARTGLHTRRHPDTVYRWVPQYEQDGRAGLIHKPRGHRGCSPAGQMGAVVRPAPGAGGVRHRPHALAAR